MLSTPAPLVTLISIFAETYRSGCSLTRPREDRIASLQKQIYFHIAEGGSPVKTRPELACSHLSATGGTIVERVSLHR